jgi:hypothetical protein
METESSFWKGRPAVHWLALLGLVLLFIVLRWNSCTAPLMRDEGEYAYAAQLLIHGVMPYDHAFIQKPPMVIYSYALAGLLWPDAFWGPRLLGYVFVALATVLLGHIARLEFGKGFALPAMALATPMILLPGLDQFPANTEMFLLLPLATFAMYVQARHHGQKTKYWLAAGFLGVTTLCFKYTALPLIGLVFAVWSVELWRQTRDARICRKNLLVAFCGGGLAMVLELGLFLAHDGGSRLWECTVQFNRLYVQSNTFNLAHLWSMTRTFWSNWWILFFLPWAIFLRPVARSGFWLATWLCAVLATSASGYGQYYVPLMPFWALLTAVGIRQLAAWLAEWPATAGRWMGGLVTVLVLILLLRPDVPWLTCTRERFVQVKMDGFPFAASPIVARRVAELSGPDDFVYVAGSEPQILCYANRFSPTRFITAYALMIPTAVTGQYQREAMSELVQHPPKLVVYTLIGNSWLRQKRTPPEFMNFLDEWLEKNYVLVGGYVPAIMDGGWVEPLPANQMAYANLLLFQRKPQP